MRLEKTMHTKYVTRDEESERRREGTDGAVSLLTLSNTKAIRFRVLYCGVIIMCHFSLRDMLHHKVQYCSGSGYCTLQHHPRANSVDKVKASTALLSFLHTLKSSKRIRLVHQFDLIYRTRVIVRSY